MLNSSIRKPAFKRETAWVLGCVLLGWTGCLLAQDAGPSAAPSGSDTSLQEVVVTAQFRQQNLEQTPLAITAVSAAMLEARNVTDLSQVAAQAPNVTVHPLGGAFGPSLGASIRGVGQWDFNPALEPGVGIYIDDVYYAQLTGSQFDLLDLDRVEILRGPQGTLEGKNSIGGSIRLISKTPTGDDTGYLEGSYGSRDLVDFRGSADFTLVDDRLFARLSGVARSQEGYVDRLDFQCANPNNTPALPELPNSNCLLGKEGGINHQGLRGMLRWVAADNLEVLVAADFTRNDDEGAPVTLLNTKPVAGNVGSINGVPYDNRFVPTNPYVSYASFGITGGVVPGYNALQAEDRNAVTGWGTSGTIDWSIAHNLSLKSITAVRQFNSHWSEDPSVSPLSLIVGIEALRHQQLSQELRLTGKAFNGLLDYTVGGFYFRETTTYVTHEDFPYVGVPGFDFLGNDPVHSTTKAGFANVEIHPTDKLSVLAGLRYTKDDKSYEYHRSNPDGSFNPNLGALDGVIGNYDAGRTDYRVGVDYQFTDDLMAYIDRSTGFKGGGVNPRPYVPTQVQPFNPETVDANEVGLKSQWLEHRLRLNLAAFYNKYKDIQLALSSCPQFNPPGFPASFPCAVPQNAGNAVIKGLELETDAQPLAGLLLDGSASYLQFHYTSINPLAIGSPANPTGPTLGSAQRDTPKWKFSLGAQYEIPLGVSTLTPRLDATYQSELFESSNSDPASRIPGYVLVNGRLMFARPDHKLEVALSVTNLANKFYYVTKLVTSQWTWAQPSEPRQVELSVKKRF